MLHWNLWPIHWNLAKSGTFATKANICSPTQASQEPRVSETLLEFTDAWKGSSTLGEGPAQLRQQIFLVLGRLIRKPAFVKNSLLLLQHECSSSHKFWDFYPTPLGASLRKWFGVY